MSAASVRIGHITKLMSSLFVPAGALSEANARQRISGSALREVSRLLPGGADSLHAVTEKMLKHSGAVTIAHPDLLAVCGDESAVIAMLVAGSIVYTLTGMLSDGRAMPLKYQRALLRENSVWLLCAQELFTDEAQRLNAEFHRPGILQLAVTLSDLGLSVEARHAMSKADSGWGACTGLDLPVGLTPCS